MDARSNHQNQNSEFPFSFLKQNRRPQKPRKTGLTEIRGSYYTYLGPRALEDLLQGMGDSIDSFKFAGGSFSLLRTRHLRDLIDICHKYSVQVSTGGFIEFVLTQGDSAVNRYIDECKAIGFDILELSAGFITLPINDWEKLVSRVKKAGLKPKPEVGIQFGAGGASKASELEAEGHIPIELVISRAKRFIEMGVEVIMIESEGITESVKAWNTEAPAHLAQALGLDHVMFEAADPEVFTWYVKTFGPEVNVFVDRSQIVQLECLRRGIWGTQSVWGRVCSYKG